MVDELCRGRAVNGESRNKMLLRGEQKSGLRIGMGSQRIVQEIIGEFDVVALNRSKIVRSTRRVEESVIHSCHKYVYKNKRKK